MSCSVIFHFKRLNQYNILLLKLKIASLCNKTRTGLFSNQKEIHYCSHFWVNSEEYSYLSLSLSLYVNILVIHFLCDALCSLSSNIQEISMQPHNKQGYYATWLISSLTEGINNYTVTTDLIYTIYICI
jgi:hypothetical protein